MNQADEAWADKTEKLEEGKGVRDSDKRRWSLSAAINGCTLFYAPSLVSGCRDLFGCRYQGKGGPAAHSLKG